MKQLTISLLVLISITAYSQAPKKMKSTPQNSRKVLNEAVVLWKKNYKTLIKEGYIGKDTAMTPPDGYFYSKTDLQNIRGKSRYLKFVFYSGEDELPRFALWGNDTSNLLLYNDGSQKNHFVKASEIKNQIIDWRNFSLTYNDSTMSYVNYYYIEWSTIDSLTNNNNYLRVDPVARAISAADTLYQVNNNKEYEGYITFDLLIRGSKEINNHRDINIDRNFSTESSYSDFAMPCPNNCPEPELY